MTKAAQNKKGGKNGAEDTPFRRTITRKTIATKYNKSQVLAGVKSLYKDGLIWVDPSIKSLNALGKHELLTVTPIIAIANLQEAIELEKQKLMGNKPDDVVQGPLGDYTVKQLYTALRAISNSLTKEEKKTSTFPLPSHFTLRKQELIAAIHHASQETKVLNVAKKLKKAADADQKK